MATQAQKTILLVEDNVIVATSETMILEKYGYNVLTAYTGESAIEVVETTSGIDLVLMDINLGKGIDGTEAAEIILQNHDLPLIFLSSHTEPGIVEKTERITSYGYIVKNSGETVLIASIKMAFRLFEAKQRETAQREALEESEKRFRLLANDLPALICEFLPDSTLTFVNRTYCEYFAMSPDQLCGRPFLDFLPEDAREGVQKEYMSLTPQQPTATYTHKVWKDGELRWQEWRERALFDENGQLASFRSIGIDITERKQYENRINVLLKERRVRLKETHHRMKSYLAILKAHLSVPADARADTACGSVLDEAAARVQTMTALNDTLYHSETVDKHSMAEFLPPFIRQVAALFHAAVPVELDVRVDRDIVVNAETLSALGIAVHELVTNSMKHAFRDTENGLIRVSARQKDNTVTLTYEDNGVGLPESASLENSPAFGLQLIQLLVEQIGGSICVGRSGGTEFEITFEASSTPRHCIGN